jgi:hypothetical protein
VSDPTTETVHGERSNLADLHPRSFRQSGRFTLKSQGKASTGLLTCHGNGDNGSGAFVEDIVTENKDQPLACLLTPADGIEVGPTDLTS